MIAMKLVAVSRSVLAGGLLVYLAACSTTDYKAPVGEFVEATRNAEKALVALDKQVSDANAAVLRERVVSGQLLVQIDPSDCQVASERCRLALLGRDGTRAVLPPKPALRKTIILMRAIREYADGLAAIVEADTADKVASQVNATLGSVEALAGTTVKLGAPEAEVRRVSEYKTPVGKAVTWLIGQYVAKVQVDGLRRATRDAKPVVRDAVALFQDIAQVAADVPKVELANTVSMRAAAFEDSRSDKTLTKLIDSAAKYDQFLLAKPDGVFARLGEAHGALADRLQNDELSLAEVMAKINAFASEANTLAQILEELEAAGGD